MTSQHTRIRADEERDLILGKMQDDLTGFRHQRVTLTAGARLVSKGLLRALELADSSFGKISGGWLVFHFLIDQLLQKSAVFRDATLGWLPLNAIPQQVLDLTAVLIFLTWLLSRLVGANSPHVLEERLLDKFAEMTQWFRRHRHARGGIRVRPTARHAFALGEIPDSRRDDVLNSTAIMAFNRWTKNASLSHRRKFFRGLASRYPSGLWIGIEYSEETDLLAVYGYAAIVPLSQHNARKHLQGLASLYEQSPNFILSEADLETKIKLYASCDAVPEEQQIAVYLLGMNVRVGLEERFAGKRLMRLVTKKTMDLVGRFQPHQPLVYCVSGVKGMNKHIHELGFKLTGHRDLRGDQFLVRSANSPRAGSKAEPTPPGSQSEA